MLENLTNVFLSLAYLCLRFTISAVEYGFSLGSASLEDATLSQHDIVDDREVRPEVELLKDHPNILSDLGQFFYVFGKLVSAHPYLAVIVLFQTVDTANHGRFA